MYRSLNDFMNTVRLRSPVSNHDLLKNNNAHLITDLHTYAVSLFFLFSCILRCFFATWSHFPLVCICISARCCFIFIYTSVDIALRLLCTTYSTSVYGIWEHLHVIPLNISKKNNVNSMIFEKIKKIKVTAAANR